MLCQFSTQRIISFFLLDWLGSLAMLALAATLCTADLALAVVLLVTCIWPGVFLALGVYDGRRYRTRAAELFWVALAIVAAGLLLAGSLYLLSRGTARRLFIVFLGLDTLLLPGSRIVLALLRRVQGQGQRGDGRRLLIVGAGDVGSNAVVQLQKYAAASLHIVGFVDDDGHKQNGVERGVPVLGTLDDLEAIVSTHRVQQALVTLPLWAHERLLETCRALQALQVHVHVVPDLFSLSFPNATLDGLGGIPVIDLGQPSVQSWYRFWKRGFDVLTAGALLLLLAPLLALVALSIKLESAGPVFYRQERVGEHGKTFAMFKFRSMRQNCDTSAHKAHVQRLIEENLDPSELNGTGSKSLKIEGDPRVTRIGRFIRKTSIDELPQLWNVIRGEMSLVGPRPPLPYEVELYQEWHKRRLQVLPGVTGWWQVKGRNRVSFDEAVRLDLFYIERASFWFDLKILFMTPLAVVSGRGAG